MKIGVSCYPTFGGSGIVATEIGLGMARRGHEVHFVTMGQPPRLDLSLANLWYHPVEPRDYPVFPQVPYALALASALVAVATKHELDVLHAHYAVPHAASAWMAREILGGGVCVVTTLHGTDITLVGADPSYLPITRHSILRSDAVTVPSRWLMDETWRRFDIPEVPIEVIPNFVDVETFHPGPAPERPTVVHVSNFRTLKRIDRVVEVFARLAARRDVRLLLVGDGPERAGALRALAERGLGNRVDAPGAVTDVERWVRRGTVFLLTSESESFGVAALEALASGVPVVACAVGGVPEVVRDGETGFLVPDGDLDGLTARVDELLADPGLRLRMSRLAQQDVENRFSRDRVLDRFEAVYRR